MDKGASSSATAPPLPTSAPPSYEEAVGFIPGVTVPPNPSMSTAPYPTEPSAMPMPAARRLPHEMVNQTPISMPMPERCRLPHEMVSQTPMSMPMPMPTIGSHMPGDKLPSTPMPQNYSQTYNAGQTFTTAPPATEVRIIHQHVNYRLGPNSVKMNCPFCHVDIKTTIISDHQASAHLLCTVLCLLGCCLCSCLPYCMSAFMRVHHFCPNCRKYIDTWKG